jgi:hypothetical protein
MLDGLAAAFNRTAALNVGPPYRTAFIALAILLMMNALVLFFITPRAQLLMPSKFVVYRQIDRPIWSAEHH